MASGDLKTQELDEITKIIVLIDRLGGQAWDMRAASLEVMDRFSDFLRGYVQDQDELKRISFRVQEFFRKLEDDL